MFYLSAYHLSICLSIYLFAYVCLCIYWFIYLSTICLSVCLVYIFIYQCSLPLLLISSPIHLLSIIVIHLHHYTPLLPSPFPFLSSLSFFPYFSLRIFLFLMCVSSPPLVNHFDSIFFSLYSPLSLSDFSFSHIFRCLV